MINGAYNLKIAKENMRCGECGDQINKDSKYIFAVFVKSVNGKVELETTAWCAACGELNIAEDVEKRNRIYAAIRGNNPNTIKKNNINKLEDEFDTVLEDANKDFEQKKKW